MNPPEPGPGAAPVTTAPAARLTVPWLHTGPVAHVLAALGRDKARVVGGAVRDALLGRPVHDVDVATLHPPETVLSLAEAAGIKAHPTGLAHGTVTLVANGTPVEVTTLRRDVETDGRHARVAFTDDWAADARRRDFRLNALYADADGQIADYVGGLADAQAGRVRFIGDPDSRIEEDALRILRFYRFSAWYAAGDLDVDGRAACRRLAPTLDRLSAERVRDELLKLLAADDPGPCVRVLWADGLLGRVLPETGQGGVDRLARLVAFTRAAPDPGGADDRLLRLGALVAPAQHEPAGDHAALASAVAERLRLSTAQAKRLRAALHPAPDREDLQAAVYRAGQQAVLDRLVLDDRLSVEVRQDAIAAVRAFDPPCFPLSGRDITALGVAPGPAVGAIMRRLEDQWVAGGFHEDRQELLARARALAADDGA